MRESDRATPSHGPSQGSTYEAAPTAHADSEPVIVAIVHWPEDEELLQWLAESATARLVLLPLESHGYRARESVLHLLWETMEWLDRYVKQSSG